MKDKTIILKTSIQGGSIMKFYETILSRDEMTELKSKGYNIYQVRDGGGDGDTLEKCVFVNHFADVVTKEEIDFGTSDYIMYQDFVESNEIVYSIDDL